LSVVPIALGDATTAGLHVALRGLAARQRAIADNVANLETPGFLAGRVDFEASLADAIAGGTPTRAQISLRRSDAATNPNGNNVRLDEETIAMVETGLSYQLAVEAMNGKLRLLRTAIGGV
jgi:flagellar basal-body rod protein FlgB